MQKIIPFLWFDNQAEEAVNFYTSLFKNAKILSITRYGEAGVEISGRPPKGTIMTTTFMLSEQKFIALNGGPYYPFSPALSFFINCVTLQEIDYLWNKLSDGGKILMELAKYPFSEKFGWLEDKFGVSWQLSLEDHIPKIVPFLMYCGKQCGKAEEAIKFYVSLFKDSTIINISHYGVGETGLEGTVKHVTFSLNGQEFRAIDSNMEHSFTFTPAISLFVNCETQKEIDRLWEKLSEGGKVEQCGWLKDKYGVSWQIVPTILSTMLEDKNNEKSENVRKVLLQMKKIDIKTLKQAYE